MSSRIPSSLKWLIDKRARLDAEIKKTEKSLAKAKELIKDLESLKTSLKAIDRSLALHEIEVDVSLIRPVRSYYVRVNLPHGELTRCILSCLRKHASDGPVRMSEIVSFIEARYEEIGTKPLPRSQLRRSIHYRMKNLAARGVVIRHHPPKTSKEGLWSLALVSDEE